MRTIIDLPDEQAKALTEWCKVEKISKAEAVRRALASMLANQQQSGREKAFGAWQKKRLDSRTFVENLREEWER
ncbi:MAG: ribbon-helix-helix protein, CopG family [Luteolibacter sp.]|uniref:ribbon-helix-helix protein, CopG family n=1 Tax=Luteolibacter sp. TaxID=1962973 RepID=UPI003265E6D8